MATAKNSQINTAHTPNTTIRRIVHGKWRIAIKSAFFNVCFMVLSNCACKGNTYAAVHKHIMEIPSIKASSILAYHALLV